MHPELANPMWSALCTSHARFALGSGALKRFPPEVAPFCALEQDGAAPGDASCLTAGETVYFLGALPKLPSGWSVLGEYTILQMVYGGGAAALARAQEEAEAPPLGAADNGAMLALSALVYPEFFRARTAELGKYIGWYQDGQLAAMAGQRLACPGYREISAVCTHPQQRGQGHAGRLIRQLARSILDDGDTPFLHVSASNKSAWTLYQNLGFAASRELPFIKVRIG